MAGWMVQVDLGRGTLMVKSRRKTAYAATARPMR